MLQLRFNQRYALVEAGIDEAGRGCLSGRVYAAAVILPDAFPDDTYLQIKDSKKLSRKKRKMLREYIEKTATTYCVAYSEPAEIDKLNILNATIHTMHKAVRGLAVEPEMLIVDGNRFQMYINDEGECIPHQLVQKGDNKYFAIAAASILAKEYHDEYVRQICKDFPDLTKYDWQNNMCYGTKKHLEAIRKHGISKFHRKTFGICKNYEMVEQSLEIDADTSSTETPTLSDLS